MVFCAVCPLGSVQSAWVVGATPANRGGATEGKEAMRGVVKALLSDEPEERGCRPAEGCAVLINVGILSHWRGRG